MPLRIPKSINCYIVNDLSKNQICTYTAAAYEKLYRDEVEVSIVMPAFNESANILRALSSLCNNKTRRGVEIIVANNNSSDDTGMLAKACGVRCIDVLEQGITHARNGGLKAAKGKFILNADADVIYPEDWIEEMIAPLDRDNSLALTYGRFSFIPIGRTSRNVYYFYEHLSQLTRWYNAVIKDEAVNVYGFNSCFRKEQGLLVGGFDHPAGTNEDGYLALKLRNAGFGRLYEVKVKRARVWTTDRRIQIDGGFIKGTFLRLKRTFW
jgi:glycosyltransferase involved in cell wall biosynthesis